MRNYKAIIQYDGTHYKGWQVQESTPDTIQGKLESILSRLAGSPVTVIGSGRTDAGVHAKGQVANFHIELPAEAQAATWLMQYLNRYLPEDIAVISLSEADERFHARFNAVSKTYRYRIQTEAAADVFSRRYAYHYADNKLDIEAMKKAALLLTGQHDFSAFCGNKHFKKSAVRTVTDIKISEVSGPGSIHEVLIDYTGDGFLQNMVRIMTGTLIEVGCSHINADAIPDILASKNRENAGFTAPAHGLCLMEVKY